MHKEISELLGTFILVLLGCGAAVIAGDSVGTLGVALSFGLAWMAATYTTGGQLNPAITFAHFMSGDMDMTSCIKHIVAQCLGAVIAVYVIMTIAPGAGVAENGFGADAETSAFLFEAIGTFLFVLMAIRIGSNKSMAALGGLVMGLMLVVLSIVGMDITGASINPARSVGPAVFAGGVALDQLWLFIVGPGVGAALAAMVVKNGMLDAPKKGKK